MPEIPRKALEFLNAAEIDIVEVGRCNKAYRKMALEELAKQFREELNRMEPMEVQRLMLEHARQHFRNR